MAAPPPSPTPLAGTAGNEIRSGRASPASPGRVSQTPFMAVRNTVRRATASSEDAAYGRSLTYWASAKSGEPPRPLPLPRRTSAMGSMSSSRAAVQTSSFASG